MSCFNYKCLKLTNWKTQIYGNNTRAYIYDDFTSRVICALKKESLERPEDFIGLVNLLAAAPLLLEVVRSIENDDGHIPAAIWKLRNEALAKARGEDA